MTVGEMLGALEEHDRDKEVLVTWFDGTLATPAEVSGLTFEKWERYGMTPKVVAIDLAILGRKKGTEK